jgi:tetratricopeptide (TPR) repeat protein
MKRILFAVACAAALLLAGCSKKEADPAVEAEARMLASEARFAMQIREFKRAEELMQRAIDLHDGQPEYWVTLGMARRRQDNISGARKAYEKAFSMHKARYKDEKNPEELAQQAFVLALLGRAGDALKLLEKGVKDHPDSAALKKMADPRGLPRTFQNPEFKALAI